MIIQQFLILKKIQLLFFNKNRVYVVGFYIVHKNEVLNMQNKEEKVEENATKDVFCTG